MPSPLEEYFGKTLEELVRDPPAELLTRNARERNQLARRIGVDQRKRTGKKGVDDAAVFEEKEFAEEIEGFLVKRKDFLLRAVLSDRLQAADVQGEAGPTFAEGILYLYTRMTDEERRILGIDESLLSSGDTEDFRVFAAEWIAKNGYADPVEAMTSREFQEGYEDFLALQSLALAAEGGDAGAVAQYNQALASLGINDPARTASEKMVAGRQTNDTDASDRDSAWSILQGSVAELVSGNPELEAQEEFLQQYLLDNREKIEGEYAASNQSDGSLFLWFNRVYGPKLRDDMDALSTVNGGIDRTLDPLLDSILASLPADVRMGLDIRYKIKQKMVEYAQEFRITNKRDLFAAFGGARIRETINEALLAEIEKLPGGAALSQWLRASGLDLMNIASVRAEGEPGHEDTLEGFIARIAEFVAQAAPDIANEAALNGAAAQNGGLSRAEVLKQMLGTSLTDLPMYFRAQVMARMSDILSSLGFGETLKPEDRARILKEIGNIREFTKATVRDVVGDLGEGAGQKILDDLDEQGVDILTWIGSMGEIRSDTEFIEKAAKTPIVSKRQPAIAKALARLEGIADLPFGIREAIQARVAEILEKFAQLNPGLSDDELLNLQELQEAVKVESEGVIESAFGDEELVREIVRVYGGTREFIKANPGLKDLTLEQARDFIKKNARKLIESAPSDADLLEARKLLEREELGEKERELSEKEKAERIAFETSLTGRRQKAIEGI